MGPVKAVGRRAENRRETEAQILDAAERIFSEAGYGGTSMQMIAQAAALPKANLHYYYPTKDALYRRVLERNFEIWHQASMVFDNPDDPVAAISGYIDSKMDVSRHYPAGAKIWASEVMNGAPHLGEFLDTHLCVFFAGREAIVRGWIARGLIAPVEPRYLIWMIWGATQHYAEFAHQMAVLNGGPLTDADWQAAKDTVRGMILRGLGLEPARLPEPVALAQDCCG